MIEKKSDSCEIFHLFLASRNLEPRLLDLSPNLNGTIRLPDTHGPPLPSPSATVWYSSHGASNLPCAYFPERAGSGWLSHRLHTRNNRAERQSAEEREYSTFAARIVYS